MIYYTERARATALNNIQRLRVRLAELPGNVLGHSETAAVLYYLSELSSAIESEQRHEKLMEEERWRRNW